MTTIYELLVAFLWVLLALFVIVVLCYVAVIIANLMGRRKYLKTLEPGGDLVKPGFSVRKED